MPAPVYRQGRILWARLRAQSGKKESHPAVIITADRDIVQPAQFDPRKNLAAVNAVAVVGISTKYARYKMPYVRLPYSSSAAGHACFQKHLALAYWRRFRNLLRPMNVAVVIALLAACALMMVLESRGLPTTLALSFKGDIKRESRWLAQYGQFVCTAAAVAIIWQVHPSNRKGAIVLAIAVSATSLCAMLIKRTLGRVRPGRENAGKYLGPSFRHSNHRESFPSSHSACAVALSVMLIHFYPHGAITFWTLALICAALRYLMDAHWPSDILGGIALGYLLANAAVRIAGV